MAWKNQGGGPWGSGPKGPWGSGPQPVGPRPPDLEDLLRRGQDRLQQIMPGGYFSGVGAFLTELYPTRLRGSGQGFCYNFGRGIGALFPFLVGALSTSTSLAMPSQRP